MSTSPIQLDKDEEGTVQATEEFVKSCTAVETNLTHEEGAAGKGVVKSAVSALSESFDPISIDKVAKKPSVPLFNGITALLAQSATSTYFAPVVKAACVQHALLTEEEEYMIPREVSKLVVYSEKAPVVTCTHTETGERVDVTLSGGILKGFVYENPVWESPVHRTTLSVPRSDASDPKKAWERVRTSEMVFETVIDSQHRSATSEGDVTDTEPKVLDIDALLQTGCYQTEGESSGVVRVVLFPTAPKTSRKYVLGETAQMEDAVKVIDTIVWSDIRVKACMLLVDGYKHVHITPAVSKAVRAGHFGTVKKDYRRLYLHTGNITFNRLSSVVVDIVPTAYIGPMSLSSF